VLDEINVSDIVLAAPSGYNVCLRVGGLDVIVDFAPNFDVIGPIRFSFLVGCKPLFLKIIKMYVWCRLH
jgi:hypothetical protein